MCDVVCVIVLWVLITTIITIITITRYLLSIFYFSFNTYCFYFCNWDPKNFKYKNVGFLLWKTLLVEIGGDGHAPTTDLVIIKDGT